MKKNSGYVQVEDEHQQEQEQEQEEEEEPKFMSTEVAHLLHHYKILPPNNYSDPLKSPRLTHERILFNFSKTYDNQRPLLGVCTHPIFLKESTFKSAKIIAIGLSSWSLSGDTALGLNITGISSTTVRLGQSKEKALIALLPGASEIDCNTLLFSTNKTKIMEFSFSNWNIQRMLDNVEKSEFNGRSTYYLPIDVDPINGEPICPLGYFKSELMRLRGVKLTTVQRTITSGVSTKTVRVDQLDYDTLREEFKDAVNDNRIIVEPKKFMIEVIPFTAEGFHCHVVIDIYYDSSP